MGRRNPSCGCCGAPQGCFDQTWDLLTSLSGWDLSAITGGERYTKSAVINRFQNYEYWVKVGNEFFGYDGDEIIIRLVNDPDGANETVFEQSVRISIGSSDGGSPPTYGRSLISTGTAGSLTHASGRFGDPGYPTPPYGIYGTYRIGLRVRDDRIEFTVNNENSIDIIHWEWYPVKMSIPAATLLTPQFDVVHSEELGTLETGWLDIRHVAEGVNLDCPPGTCEFMDPYTHLEWRISNEDFWGETIKPYKGIYHNSCVVSYIGGDLQIPITDAELSLGAASGTAFYFNDVYDEVYSCGGFYISGGTPYLERNSIPKGSGQTCCGASVYDGPTVAGFSIGVNDRRPFFETAENLIVDGIDCCVTFNCNSCFSHVYHQAALPTTWQTGQDTAEYSVGLGAANELRWGIATSLYPTIPDEDISVDWVITTAGVEDRFYNTDINSIINDTLPVLEVNNWYIVTSELGNGLGFAHSTPGIYSCEMQWYAPIVLAALPTAQEQQDLQDLLLGSGVTWWFELETDSKFYSIDENNGLLGPFDESQWVEPPDRMAVRVTANVRYLKYFSAVDADSTESYKECGLSFIIDDDYVYTPYPDTLPPNTSPPTSGIPPFIEDPIKASVQERVYKIYDLSDYDLSPDQTCGGSAELYNYVTVPQTAYVSTQVVNGPLLTGNRPYPFCGPYNPVQTSILTVGDEYDFLLPLQNSTQTVSGNYQTGNVSLSITIYQSPDIVWEQIVDRPAHQDDLPTINFNGGHMLSDYNLQIKLLKSVLITWGIWPECGDLEDFQSVYEHAIKLASAINFTVGPAV